MVNMKEKYLNLIELLVQEHKKFSLYESIKDEIVNYVFENAETVIKNINNDEVLNSYLSKLVATAMVVVPKKLNVLVERKSEAIVFGENQNLRKKDLIAEDSNKPNLIADSELEEHVQIKQNDNIYIETDFNNQSILESSSDIIDKESVMQFENKDLVIQENINENLVDVLFSDKTNKDQDTMIEVNQVLVDNMINGINPNISEELHFQDDSKESMEVFSDYEDLESLEIIENDENVESTEDVELSSNIDSFVEPVIEPLNQDSDLDYYTEDSDFETDDLLIQSELDVDNVSKSDLPVDSIIKDDLSYEDDVLELVVDETITSGSEDASSLETDELNDIEIDSVEENIVNMNIMESDDNVLEKNIQNFQCFDYEPVSININSEEVFKCLLDLNTKYSELNILKICEYRYYKKMSIKEISSVLDIQAESIVEALNLIVDVIKDK